MSDRNFLRNYREYKIYEAGPVEGGDPQDQKIVIDNSSDEQVHTVFYNSSQPENLNKGIERAKEWIDEKLGITANNDEVVIPAPVVEQPKGTKKKKNSDSASQEPPKERKCRECGCTEKDCTQCIEKTGSRCYWVEEDLCSACVPEPSVIVNDSRATAAAETEIVEPVLTEPTNFFSQLASHGKIDLTLRLFQTGDKIIGEIYPGPMSKTNLKPLKVEGTIQEYDDEFFKSIMPQVVEIAGLKTIQPGDAAPHQITENAGEEAKAEKVQSKRPVKKSPKKPKPKPIVKPKTKTPPKAKVAPKAKPANTKTPKEEKKVDTVVAEEKAKVEELKMF